MASSHYEGQAAEGLMWTDNAHAIVPSNGAPTDLVLNLTGSLDDTGLMGDVVVPADTESNNGTDAIPAFGYVAPYSQNRADRENEELQKALSEVGKLNPERGGPLKLSQISRWAAKNIIEHARSRRPDSELQQTWINPENLVKARDGPATDIDSRIYQKLMHRLRKTNTESAQARASLPPGLFQDDDDLEMKLDEAWKKKVIGTPDYHGQWTAYQASPRLYPVRKDGNVELVSLTQDYNFDTQPIPLKVENPPHYQQVDFNPNWGYWPVNHRNPEMFRERFFEWLSKTPLPGVAVDVCHTAFFDGTSCPDGGSSMMIMKEKHGMTYRNADDEQTRLHWHETSSCYIYTIRVQLKKKAMDLIRESQREMALRGTLERSNKRTHPYLILRPGEFTDVEDLVPVFNWYAENTTLLPETSPTNKVEIHRIIQACRDRSLPFIVAVPDRSVEVLEKRPNDPEILGFAYVKRFNDERSTGEIRVFVHKDCKRLQIGTGLVDMILRSCDIGQCPEGPRPYQFKGREKLAYGDGYPCKLSNLVCAIAYESDRMSEYQWIKKWLVEKFRFEHMGHIKDGRMKFGHRLNVWLISRKVWSGHPEASQGDFVI